MPIVEGGYLTIRRSDALGKLAFPGGFIETTETWQHAAAREMKEEANIDVDPSEIKEFKVISALDTSTIIIFGMCKPRKEKELPPFAANKETSERIVLREYQPLAFEVHSKLLRDLLTGNNSTSSTTTTTTIPTATTTTTKTPTSAATTTASTTTAKAPTTTITTPTTTTVNKDK